MERRRSGGLLRSLYDWLAEADPPGKADLIFALAGRQSRKVGALSLFRQGKAPRLLLSTARFEIRPFAKLDVPHRVNLQEAAATIPPTQRHFFVSFEGSRVQVELVPVGRFGTLGEIQALVNWLRNRPEIRSLWVVSSGAHLRRVRMCCQALLPEPLEWRIVAAPDENPWLHRDHWWRERRATVLVLSELAKLLLYRLVLARRGGQTRKSK